MKRICICIMAAVSVMAAASCQKIEVESVVDPRFEPVGEGVELNNVPFEVKITEKRMYKVIHWTFDAAKGKFVPDCSKVGALAITDWNEVSVDVVSDSPDFQGVKVKSEGDGIIVGYDPKNGADSLKHFTLKRNRDNKESVKGNIVTFYTGETPDSGRKVVLDNIEAAEYINIQSVRISVKTMEGLRGSLPNCNLAGKFLPPDNEFYHDGEEYTCKFIGGYPADNRSGGWYQFAGTSIKGIGYPIKITFLEIIPNNTSWRTFDVENRVLNWHRENSTESEYKKKENEWLENINCYIKLYKLDYLPYGKSMDWDELKGKEIISDNGTTCFIPLTSPTFSKSEQIYTRGGTMTATFSN